MGRELARREEVAELVGRLAVEGLDGAERRRLLARLAGQLAVGARSAGARAAVTGRWLADVVTDVAPHIPVRDLPTLREHHGGLSRDALAASLVRSACLTTGSVGAAGGALAAAAYAAPPSLLAAPVKLAAETVAVVAVELKLVAELHVVYGCEPPGSRSSVSAAYVDSWARRRGVEVSAELPGLGIVLGTAARQKLRSRLAARVSRGTAGLAPFLVGAVAGAELNRRETRQLGDRLVEDLRR